MSKYTEGDVNHNVQPVIGWLRMFLHGQDGDMVMIVRETVEGIVRRLYLACEAEDWLLGDLERLVSSWECRPGVAESEYHLKYCHGCGKAKQVRDVIRS
jgi:hypothetical protein